MVKCPFCVDKHAFLNLDKEKIVKHLIVTLNEEGGIHVHGPIKEKEIIRSFILAIGKEAGIEIEDEG